jgi:Sec-independent protein secretion pathway component TatC
VYRKLLKIFAGLMIFFSILLLIFESMTNILSTVLCHKFCPEQYIASLEPKIMDPSCLFDTDMYLNFSIILLLIFGIILNVLSSKNITPLSKYLNF